ncbi:MAG: transketolase [Eubacteriales bacterium]|nr:transketolase [Eubacteriales bacterium]
MQIAYIKALYEIMKSDSSVVSLLSDSGTDYDAMMMEEMPDQCYNFGIAEQNQVAIAAGMAMCGKTPFVYTSGAFLAYRSYEFIRNDVCYQNQNVKIVGMGSGTSWHTLGPSHHTTEDFAGLRAIPNLVVLSPATPFQVEACIRAAYQHKGPVYVRLGMSGEREFYSREHIARIGGSHQLTDGKNLAVFCTGSILSEVMEAQELLKKDDCHAAVYDMYSIKPLDRQQVLKAAENYKNLVTIEEHNIIGGLGSAVAEVLTEEGVGVPVLRIGLNDAFAIGYGTQKEVRQMNGLDAGSLRNRIYDFLARKPA